MVELQSVHQENLWHELFGGSAEYLPRSFLCRRIVNRVVLYRISNML